MSVYLTFYLFKMQYKTIKEQAIALVPEYGDICKLVTRRFVINGRSNSCVNNYLRQVAKMVIYYGRSPIDLTIDELEDYLFYLKHTESPSLSSYKHLVYGLRHIYRLCKNTELVLALPKVIYPKKLPVVLSKNEVRKLLIALDNEKHRLLLGTIYDGGLRISEAANLQVSDVDFDRKSIHIRNSKGKKDRYVPISDMLVRGVKSYITKYQPVNYLFNGNIVGKPISCTAIRVIVLAALRKSKINKSASAHTLRHSYATHLLEDGLDIISVKNQLGHSCIQNTMMYLHIAQLTPLRGFSPLTTLYRANQLPVYDDAFFN